MTRADIQRELIAIAKLAHSGDFEAAHAAEDALHQRVLGVVAEEATEAGKLAREALRTLELRFTRACA